MKKALKFICLFVTVSVILILVFASCGSKDDQKDVSGENNQNSQLQTSETDKTSEAGSEPTAEPTPEISLDLGGRVIKYITADGRKDPERGRSENGDKDADRVDAMKQKYNFNFEYIATPFDEMSMTITSGVMSGMPPADIAIMDIRWVYPNFLASNILIPWDELGYLDPKDEKWDRMSVESGTYKGKVYAGQIKPFYPRGHFFWNKSMLERENQPDIHELQKNKQWTWDKFVEITTAMQKDLDNDGVLNINGVSGGDDFTGLMIFSNNAQSVKIENDKPVFSLGDQNGLEALSFLQDLRNKYKVWAVPENSAWDWFITAFRDGKTAMMGGSQWMQQYFKDMTDDYAYCFPPMGPKATDYVSVAREFNIEGLLSGIDKPQDVAFIFNLRTNPLPDITQEDWLQSYESTVRDEGSLEFVSLLLSGEYNVPDMMQWFSPVVNMSYSYMNRIISGNESPAAVIEEITMQAQQSLDDVVAELQ